MADWSVEEQTIPAGVVDAPITSIGLRVDYPDTSYMLMELRTASDSYLLRFQRNGAFVGWQKVEPPAAAAAAEAPAAPVEEEEPAHSGRGRRR